MLTWVCSITLLYSVTVYLQLSIVKIQEHVVYLELSTVKIQEKKMELKNMNPGPWWDRTP